MSAATLLFGTVAARQGDVRTQTLPLGNERGDDLYALWKNVFDRAQAVRYGDGSAAAPAEVDGRGGDASVALHGATGPAAEPSPSMSRGQPPVAERVDAGVAPALRALTLRGSFHASAAPLVAVAPADIAPKRPDQPARPIQPARAAAFDGEAEQAPAPESVSVFVQGMAVSIVVRDAVLSEHEALRSGFETARRLTGQRASLAQLTLNGRVAYQKQGVPDPVVAGHAGPSLVFSC